ncbi:MAG: hypothetical protein IPL92_01715 [Saprospiraceae bacterium]|nr:hypothetical protein [Candidatus Opimibacter iunctus]
MRVQRDAGSQKPSEFPEQLNHYLNIGLGPDNFEQSILKRPSDQHNEIGLSDYEICGWFIDLNPTSSLSIDMGTSDPKQLHGLLKEWNFPCYAWEKDTLKVIKSFEPYKYGDIISLSDFYTMTS